MVPRDLFRTGKNLMLTICKVFFALCFGIQITLVSVNIKYEKSFCRLCEMTCGFEWQNFCEKEEMRSWWCRNMDFVLLNLIKKKIPRKFGFVVPQFTDLRAAKPIKSSINTKFIRLIAKIIKLIGYLNLNHFNIFTFSYFITSWPVLLPILP